MNRKLLEVMGLDPFRSYAAPDDVEALGSSGLWAHPCVGLLADERASWLGGLLGRLESLVGGALNDARLPLNYDWCIVAHGSAVATRLTTDSPDVDIAVRLRLRPDAHYRGLRHAHEDTVGGVEPFVRVLLDRVQGDPGLRVARFRTEWNSALCGEHGNATPPGVNWTPEDVAVGSAWSSRGEVGLREAMLASSTNHLTMVLGTGTDARIVDATIDRSIVAPRGIVDVSAAWTSLWFGKVAASEAVARRAAAMESELATLFPGRYDPMTVMVEAMRPEAASMRRGDRPMKQCKRATQLWARFGCADRLERYEALFRSPVGRASAMANLAGLWLHMIRRHELADHTAHERCVQALLAMASHTKLAADDRGAPWNELAEDTARAAETAQRQPDDPRVWGDAWRAAERVERAASDVARGVVRSDTWLQAILVHLTS